MFNSDTISDLLAKPIFDGRTVATQRLGIHAIVTAWNKDHISEHEKVLAFVLAVVAHETARTMLPTEGEPNDQTNFVGRGYIHLRSANQMGMFGQQLGLDLHQNPQLQLHPDVAARVLLLGLLEGWFTGFRAQQFFSKSTSRVNAAWSTIYIPGDPRMAGYDRVEQFYDATLAAVLEAHS